MKQATGFNKGCNDDNNESTITTVNTGETVVDQKAIQPPENKVDVTRENLQDMHKQPVTSMLDNYGIIT